MASELTDDQRRSFLKDEYFFLQAQYEDYDRRSLQIKGWVSSGAVAALALAFNTSSMTGALILPVIAATIVVAIWYLEAYWKLFQYALADRIRIIEAHFRNESDILIKNPEPLQIYHWWFLSFNEDKPIYKYEEGKRPRSRSARLREVAFQRFVCLPYLPILILCAASLVALLAGQLTASVRAVVAH
jgi:hypothetical protein